MSGQSRRRPGRSCGAGSRCGRRHGSAGLLFLDLDHFKQINDSLGHGVGDELLEQAARRLSQCVQGKDTVARLGGDEFVILLDDLTHEDEAVGRADKILASFQPPFRLNGRDYVLSISIGIVVRGADHGGAENSCATPTLRCTMPRSMVARVVLSSDSGN